MAHFRFSIRIILQVFFILYIMLHWKFDLEIGLLLNKKIIDLYLQPEPIHVEHSSPKSFSFLFILIEKIDIFKWRGENLNKTKGIILFVIETRGVFWVSSNTLRAQCDDWSFTVWNPFEIQLEKHISFDGNLCMLLMGGISKWGCCWMLMLSDLYILFSGKRMELYHVDDPFFCGCSLFPFRLCFFTSKIRWRIAASGSYCEPIVWVGRRGVTCWPHGLKTAGVSQKPGRTSSISFFLFFTHFSGCLDPSFYCHDFHSEPLSSSGQLGHYYCPGERELEMLKSSR